jgi:thiazole synthase
MKFQSRLLIGTEQYKTAELLKKVAIAANTDTIIITYDFSEDGQSGLLLTDIEQIFKNQRVNLIGTTSFAKSGDEAIKVARLLRDTLGVNVIKLDVRKHIGQIIPDNKGTFKASTILLSEGFYILPMIIPDPVMAIELEQLGCSAIRVLASPIGCGMGLLNLHLIQEVIKTCKLPVVVEGGLGDPSDVVLAMEAGAEAVLVNTAIAQAQNPENMARAMRLSVEAGRIAYINRIDSSNSVPQG